MQRLSSLILSNSNLSESNQETQIFIRLYPIG